jgi:addiction module HigA family antidote
VQPARSHRELDAPLATLFHAAAQGPKRSRSWIIIEVTTMKKTTKRLAPIPPGEILLEEYMKPSGLSQNRLARDIDVNPARVNDIVHGRSAITAPVALRLAKYFGTTPELWMNLQADYELRKARATDWPRIERRVRVMAAE